MNSIRIDEIEKKPAIVGLLVVFELIDSEINLLNLLQVSLSG